MIGALDPHEAERISEALRHAAESMSQDLTSDLDVMFRPKPFVEGIMAERTFVLPDGRRIALRMSIDLEAGS